ncbi:hypothetical protein [Canicola haemoglobinophilus]|nr:hypothetical protein [Canicola haemoglobinophilus]
MINKESREFNKLLSDEIEKMDGVILSRRGKLNGFFSLDVTFENSRLYDKNKFLEYIKSIGFVLDEGISSTSKVKLFCKGEIGVSISGSIRLRIYYDYRMSECKNKN